jgi:hypothetical protein
MASLKGSHILKTLNTGLSNMRFIFFDVETKVLEETDKGITQEFRLCTANLVNFRKNGSFRVVDNLQTKSKEDFYLWFLGCLQRRKVMHVLSANIWFDIRNSGLFLFLMGQHWEQTMFYSKGFTTIIKLRYEEYTVLFLNMQQFIPANVEKMGYMVGLWKLDLSVHWWNDDDVMTYCQRDTDIITEVFKQWLVFLRINDLGRFSYTIASQSFTAYRYRFLFKKIYIHRHTWLTAFERKCYHGGRTDIFYQGSIKGEKIYNLDINSMYPFVMSTNKMPVQAVDIKKLPSLITVRAYASMYAVMGWCAIDTDEPVYNKVYKDKLCFPTGRFTTYLTDPEMRYALSKHHLKSVYYLAVYKKDYIFREYMAFFHKMKTAYEEQDNTTYRYIAKLFMNSLYGKFGQKIDIPYFEDRVDPPEYSHESVVDADTNIVYKELKLGYKRQVYQEAAGDAYNSFVAIAAHVTGLARMYLWKLIKLAGDKNVYYCDTDSIFCNHKGFTNLSKYINNNELGMLGVKGKSYDTTIFCPKDYIFNNEATTKGVKKGSSQNKDGSFSLLVFPSFRSDMKSGLDKPYRIRKINKFLKREYNKGEVMSDGWVRPYQLADF